VSQALVWDGCLNVRDLGGLPVTGGGRIRSRALVRADSPHHLTSAGRQALRDYGVARIIDLRQPDEVALDPNPFADDPGYRHQPAFDPARAHEYKPDNDPTLGHVYRSGLARNARTMTAAVGLLADAPPGAVLIHCHAGKDRTGIVVALVLSAVGVDDDTIVEDYAASSAALRPRLEALLDAAADDNERAWIREWRDTHPVTMRAMLDALHNVHGGAERYLTDHGLTPGQLTRLRDRMTTGTTRKPVAA
jgi:protein tyrosine/serine phosphatase